MTVRGRRVLATVSLLTVTVLALVLLMVVAALTVGRLVEELTAALARR